MTDLEATTRTIAAYLHDCVDEVDEDSSGTMSFPFGSTRVFIVVSETQGTTFVQLRAHVAHHVPTSHELMSWLAAGSDDLVFGHVTLTHEAGDSQHANVYIRHTLLASCLQLEEMRLALALVATAADRLDDILVERFGGKRYVDIDDT